MYIRLLSIEQKSVSLDYNISTKYRNAVVFYHNETILDTNVQTSIGWILCVDIEVTVNFSIIYVVVIWFISLILSVILFLL